MPDRRVAGWAVPQAVFIGQRRRSGLSRPRREAIVRAHDDGVPVATIAEFAVLDRKSVYKQLRQGRDPCRATRAARPERQRAPTLPAPLAHGVELAVPIHLLELLGCVLGGRHALEGSRGCASKRLQQRANDRAARGRECRVARRAGAGSDRRAWPSTWIVWSLSDAIRQWNAMGRGQPGRAILRA
jgi:hypothetical protein